MDKLYKLNGNVAEITVSLEVYPLITIKKAIANYMEIAYISLKKENSSIIIKIQSKNKNEDLDYIVGEFYNELLRESLRYEILIETKNLRELIFARALYTTCVDTNDHMEEIDDESKFKGEEFDLNEIAVNWFDTNNNKEEKKC